MAGRFVSTTCTYCQEEINDLRIQCCVCTDFEICLECFSVGAEIGEHRRDHPYKFVDQSVVNIFGSGSWTDKEELQLLEAMDLYTFGNWERVSKHLEKKTAAEVETEYTNRYVNGTVGRATWREVANSRPIVNEINVSDKEEILPPLEDSKQPPTVEGAADLGYIFLRDDYHIEYDSQAEQLVSCLELDLLQDAEAEVALKLAFTDMYVRRVRERTRRKKIVREHGLVRKFLNGELEDNETLVDENNEIRKKMRRFCQFLSDEEYRSLVDNITKQKNLKVKLFDLLRIQMLGVTPEKLSYLKRHYSSSSTQE